MTIQFKMINLELILYYLKLCIVRNLEIDIILLIKKTYIFKILERFEIKNTKKINTLIIKKKYYIFRSQLLYKFIN